ncbi:MAG: putative PEP-binding protein [Pseudomonadota bacterium]
MAKDQDFAGLILPFGGACDAGRGVREGGEPSPREIGAKGWALDRAYRAGAPVPDGFIISAAALPLLAQGSDEFDHQIEAAVAALESATGRRLGDAVDPLLTVVALSPETWLPDLTPPVRGVGAPVLDDLFVLPPLALIDEIELLRGVAASALNQTTDDLDSAIDDAEGDELAALRAVLAKAGVGDWPPGKTLKAVIAGQAARWRDKRAQRRRVAAGASERCAIIVQTAPCSSASADDKISASGRLSLHDAEDGRRRLVGEWRSHQRGAEDPARPSPIRFDGALPEPVATSAVGDALLEACEVANAALPTPREISFVVVDGAPWIVGARPLRASVAAQIKIAVTLAESGRITQADAIRRIDPRRLEDILHRRIDPEAQRILIAQGLPASPGAASGVLAFSAEEAEKRAVNGENVILICEETSPEDVHALHAAAAVMTLRGGLTSHAAVVARGMAKPCVVGASGLRIDHRRRVLIAPDGGEHAEGAAATLDGASGAVLQGALPTKAPELTGDFATLMRWADDLRQLRVRANADTPSDAETAQRLGVDGIGLCRTEHMFVDKSRVTAVREMILADTEAERRAALEKLLPIQRADFEKVFEIMSRPNAKGAKSGSEARPVTIRLLDPPLHEFLPQTARGLSDLARAMGQSIDKVTRRANELREFNPMLGKRGCRMGVAYPEIYEMQARAIFEAALRVEARTGVTQKPELMIPLVSAVRELELLREKLDAVAAAVREEQSASFEYQIGIMVETPRAALRADALAAVSTFFSFGTNDLTQMTYGLSRDDAGRLMRDYVERGVFEADPFQSLDQEGVGELMQIAVERGRAANANLTIGLCGEHGGDPATIAFCEAAAFDYVSCSPFRTPIARLAAAQAALASGRRG